MVRKRTNIPTAIQMTSRIKMAHGVPYSEIEITDDADPTITNPMMHSRDTVTNNTVDVGNCCTVATIPLRGPD
jgi:hypothetical protein